jgi:hypothetical protein
VCVGVGGVGVGRGIDNILMDRGMWYNLLNAPVLN